MRLIVPSAILLLAAATPCLAALDPARLSTHSGRVAQYSLSPRGDVDGLILDDRTEVFLPPHLGQSLVQIAGTGDAVTIQGLQARALAMMQALSIVNDGTGRRVEDDGTADAVPEAPRERPHRMTIMGRVKMALHGPRGDLNGALLEDGTIVRLPPPEAARLAAWLQPGVAVVATGEGGAGPLGRFVAAQRLDRSAPPQ